MGLNFFLSIIRNFWWRHQIVIWERSIWIVTLQHMNNLTVSFLRQYNRCIIKIATVRFYDVFTIKFCNNVFHDLWSFYVKSSITRWSCSTTMSLGNVKIDTRIWHFAWREYLKRPPCKAFRILSWICTDFCELFCFVHLYKSLNSIQYRDFHSHRSYDRQKVLVDVLDWYASVFYLVAKWLYPFGKSYLQHPGCCLLQGDGVSPPHHPKICSPGKIPAHRVDSLKPNFYSPHQRLIPPPCTPI